MEKDFLERQNHLNELVASGASYEDILKESQEFDKDVIRLMKAINSIQ